MNTFEAPLLIDLLPHAWRSDAPTAGTLPCGRMVALRRIGAAPPGDEVLRGHRRQQQGELQHRGGRQLRHDRAR